MVKPASSVLRTRDGKELKELGSWEREELKNLRKLPIDKADLPKNSRTASLRDPSMRFITRPDRDAPHWNVKPYTEKREYLGARNFKDRDYGGPERALVAAKKYRDKVVYGIDYER